MKRKYYCNDCKHYKLDPFPRYMGYFAMLLIFGVIIYFFTISLRYGFGMLLTGVTIIFIGWLISRLDSKCQKRYYKEYETNTPYQKGKYNELIDEQILNKNNDCEYFEQST